MLYFGIETGITKSKYIFFVARYYISQLNQSYWKKEAYMFQKDCCKASRNNVTIWIVIKKLFQKKLYTFPKKEMYLISNNNAFPNWSKHLEKGI